jgi:hypothetical protein
VGSASYIEVRLPWQIQRGQDSIPRGVIKEREDNHENVCDDHDQCVDPDRSGGPDEPWRAAGSDQADRHHVESIDSTGMNITV